MCVTAAQFKGSWLSSFSETIGLIRCGGDPPGGYVAKLHMQSADAEFYRGRPDRARVSQRGADAMKCNSQAKFRSCRMKPFCDVLPTDIPTVHVHDVWCDLDIGHEGDHAVTLPSWDWVPREQQVKRITWPPTKAELEEMT